MSLEEPLYKLIIDEECLASLVEENEDLSFEEVNEFMGRFYNAYRFESLVGSAICAVYFCLIPVLMAAEPFLIGDGETKSSIFGIFNSLNTVVMAVQNLFIIDLYSKAVESFDRSYGGCIKELHDGSSFFRSAYIVSFFFVPTNFFAMLMFGVIMCSAACKMKYSFVKEVKELEELYFPCALPLGAPLLCMGASLLTWFFSLSILFSLAFVPSSLFIFLNVGVATVVVVFLGLILLFCLSGYVRFNEISLDNLIGHSVPLLVGVVISISLMPLIVFGSTCAMADYAGKNTGEVGDLVYEFYQWTYLSFNGVAFALPVFSFDIESIKDISLAFDLAGVFPKNVPPIEFLDASEVFQAFIVLLSFISAALWLLDRAEVAVQEIRNSNSSK